MWHGRSFQVWAVMSITWANPHEDAKPTICRLTELVQQAGPVLVKTGGLRGKVQPSYTAHGEELISDLGPLARRQMKPDAGPQTQASRMVCLFTSKPTPHPNPAVTDFGLQPYIALVYCFNSLHPCNRCIYMDYYSFTDPGGTEGWADLVGWPMQTPNSLPTK